MDNVAGWDSMATIMLCAQCEEDFGVKIGFDRIAETKSFADLYKLIEGLTRGHPTAAFRPPAPRAARLAAGSRSSRRMFLSTARGCWRQHGVICGWQSPAVARPISSPAPPRSASHRKALSR
jgi:hypothetical protein